MTLRLFFRIWVLFAVGVTLLVWGIAYPDFALRTRPAQSIVQWLGIALMTLSLWRFFQLQSPHAYAIPVLRYTALAISAGFMVFGVWTFDKSISTQDFRPIHVNDMDLSYFARRSNSATWSNIRAPYMELRPFVFNKPVCLIGRRTGLEMGSLIYYSSAHKVVEVDNLKIPPPLLRNRQYREIANPKIVFPDNRTIIILPGEGDHVYAMASSDESNVTYLARSFDPAFVDSCAS